MFHKPYPATIFETGSFRFAEGLHEFLFLSLKVLILFLLQILRKVKMTFLFTAKFYYKNIECRLFLFYF